MKLGFKKQTELLTFLNEECLKFIENKKLTPKNKIIIMEYTSYLKHKIDGKTSTQRINNWLKNIK